MWSFKIIEWQIHGDEVLVLGQLSIFDLTKQQFGSSRITKSKKDGSIIDLGGDIKSAASDSLKKCSSLFGVALNVYSNGTSSKKTDKPVFSSNGNGRITQKQLDKMHELVDQLDSADWPSFKDYAQGKFNCVPEYLDRKNASELIGEMIGYVQKEQTDAA